MNPTPQQEKAIGMIRDFVRGDSADVFVLRGYAGTGKTWLIHRICEWLDSEHIPVQLMAPTGRAAKVLSDTTHNACTIHRAIYVFGGAEDVLPGDGNDDDENGKNERADEPTDVRFRFVLRDKFKEGVCIVDEASMVPSSKDTSETMFQFGSGNLLKDLLRYADIGHGGKIIFVGDPMQLPPVGETYSAALDVRYFTDNGIKTACFELTDIVRQRAESVILRNSMAIRSLIEKKQRNTLVLERKDGEVEDAVGTEVAQRYCDNKADSAVVCQSNSQAAMYNAEIRNILFPDQSYVCPGDRLLVVKNSWYNSEPENPDSHSLQLFNGDFVTVVEVSDTLEPQSATVYVKEERRKVTLWFRRVTIITEDGTEQRRFIIESLLNGSAGALEEAEQKALYVNFKMRFEETHKRPLKPRSPSRIKKGNSEQIKQRQEYDAAMKAYRAAIEDYNKSLRRAAISDPYYNALQVKFGYAFTCHKAQGGEWSNVFVDFTRRTGLDDDSLRWKYTAITRAREKLVCVNLPDITPVSGLAFGAISKASSPPADALSYAPTPDTPFHHDNPVGALKSKYWSVVANMSGTEYSVENVRSYNWRERYSIRTPNGTVSVDAIYNGAYAFVNYSTQSSELLRFFTDESNIAFSIEYTPSTDSLKGLYAKIVSLCDELGIVLTNVTERPWMVVYYMRASGKYASLSFSFNSKGYITRCQAVSDLGPEDSKLAQLIERLKCPHRQTMT